MYDEGDFVILLENGLVFEFLVSGFFSRVFGLLILSLDFFLLRNRMDLWLGRNSVFFFRRRLLYLFVGNCML